MNYRDVIRYLAERGDYGDLTFEQVMETYFSPQVQRQLRTYETVVASGRVLQIDNTPLPDGRFVRIYTDITGRKRAEAEITKKTAILETTLEHMDQGIWVADGELNVLAFNRRVRELFELPDILFEDGAVDYLAIIRYQTELGDYGELTFDEVIETYFSTDVQRQRRTYEITRSSGVVVEVRNMPLPGGGFVRTYTDMTERKRAEEELRRQTNLLNDILESTGQGIVAYDRDHRIIAFNRNYTAIWPLSEEISKVGRNPA